MDASTIGKGIVAGLIGTAVMTLSEKIEQALTGRPSSFVPARTAERLAGLPRKPAHQRRALNLAMHYGNGLAGGVARAVMARYGVRGPFANLMLTNVRLLMDQTMENATGVGAPPWTWPRDEQVLDMFHKGVYAAATGYAADLLVRNVTGRRPAPSKFVRAGGNQRTN